MNARKHILLINPTITSKRSARFPLAVLNLSAALDGHYDSSILDGNKDREFIASAVQRIDSGGIDVVGVSVMGGPQLKSAIAVSKAIKARHPRLPIVWGGHFPTICAEPALMSPYVDYAVRGQGEDTLRELLDAHFGGASDLGGIDGMSWRNSGEIVHNPNRLFSKAGLLRALPFERLGDPRQYFGSTYLGRRTMGYQAAIGCRFRCTFCGVATMFRGKTALPAPQRLDLDLGALTRQYGMDSVQFYDHNFFDREADTAPLLEVLARHRLPWWCFARSDALLNLSEASWALVRKSRLRMAYIGAESPSNWLLHDVRKGTSSDQTLAVVEKCRSNGVIPELSFMLAPPQDPEGETERTFDFIRHIKRLHPKTEIMLYIYAPLPSGPYHKIPQVERALEQLRDGAGARLAFPTTADGWARPEWINYWCHTDVPWLSEPLRKRIRDFTTVLGCRFPTVQDVAAPPWSKTALRALAAWRYRFRRYDSPWELNLSKKLIKLADPKVTSI